MTFDDASSSRVVMGLVLLLAAVSPAEPPLHVRLLETQRQSVVRLEAKPGEEALCEVARQTSALVNETQRAFSEGVPRELRELKLRGVAGSTSIPDGLVFWVVDFEALGGLAPSTKASKLFLAASPLVKPLASALPSLWWRQESSLRACSDFTSLGPRLNALAQADAQAPDCARALVDQPVAEALEALGGTKCFCAGTRKGVAGTLAALKTLRWKAARRAVASLEKATASPAAWGCLDDTIDFTR
ncbi:MAG: hypothetical protein Q8L14_20215 [Myxococcales bacterium]|nr:hypothetical protein [Myxococcales bacterium]